MLAERYSQAALPALPFGYGSQPAWGFRDGTGRFSYEFHRVYGAASVRPGRGPTSSLEPDLSFWVVTWPTFTETGDEKPACRCVSYAEAKKLLRSHLSFERFSSMSQMREQLPGLLRVRDLARAPVTPGSRQAGVSSPHAKGPMPPPYQVARQTEVPLHGS